MAIAPEPLSPSTFKTGMWKRKRKLEAEAGSGSGGSGPFSVEAEAEAEARKFYRFRFHIGGKNGGRNEIGSAIRRRRANRESINIKKGGRGGVV